MIIRKEQIEAMEEIRPGFEDSMVDHLKSFTPLHWESLGEPGMRTLIREGIKRAAAQGFTRFGAVRFYLETVVLLGIGFDHDPQYAALAEALGDVSSEEQMTRADRAWTWMIAYLDNVGGHNREHAYRALLKTYEQPPKPQPVSSPDFEARALQQMRDIHPQKVDFLGEAALRGLIARAKDEARRFDAETDFGVCLFLGLMFAVGHRILEDPKYPWVYHTLTNTAITDRDSRVSRLYSKSMTYLGYALGKDGKAE